MPRSPNSQLLALFVTVSLIWGTTWIAIKIGVSAMPALTLSALRSLAAGMILLALAESTGLSRRAFRSAGKIVPLALLTNALPYAGLFWGMQYVDSGVAAVVNLALMPIGLFAFGLAFGEETYLHRRLAGVFLGVCGLVVLFWPRLEMDPQELSVWGLTAIVLGTLAYCLGSVLSRPLLREISPLAVSGLHMFIGGIGLAVIAVAVEPVSGRTLSALLQPAVLASFLFLVVAGGAIAFAIYMRLIRDWGPTRAGLYAFVSPIVAVILGVVVLDESFGPFELVGSAIMLGAAALSIGGPDKTVHPGPGPDRGPF